MCRAELSGLVGSSTWYSLTLPKTVPLCTSWEMVTASWMSMGNLTSLLAYPRLRGGCNEPCWGVLYHRQVWEASAPEAVNAAQWKGCARGQSSWPSPLQYSRHASRFCSQGVEHGSSPLACILAAAVS